MQIDSLSTQQRNWRRRHWLTVLLFLLAAVAGCSPGDRFGDREGIDNESITIVYVREGGFAGVSQEWIIHLDGTIDGPADQELTVPAEQVQKIVETGLEADLATAMDLVAAEDSCCDQFTYTLTLKSGNKSWQLTKTDTSDVPPEVSELFDMVENLIAGAQPAP